MGEDPEGPRAKKDPQERLHLLLDRLGPDWDEPRVIHAPTDEATVEEVLQRLPVTVHDPESHKPPRLRPTGGWAAFLLPMAGVLLIVLGVLLVGVDLMDPMTGTLLIAGGFLLIILAALGRGKRVQEHKRRKQTEEVLLYYDLEPDASREMFLAQVALVREAKRVLQETKQS